nr:ORF1 [Torque teno felis virus]
MWRRRWPRRRRRRYWRKPRRFKRRYFRRRLHRTVRHRRVYENIPSRHRYIYVRGWEPLGNLCHSDKPTSEATPYNSLEDSSGVWHGTWGKHFFTVGNLLLRAASYWNQWSDDWSSYDYVQFLSGKIMIVPDSSASWMINFDPYLQTNKLVGNKSGEDLWIHPGIMLNTPHTHIIYPQTLFQRKKYYKIKIVAPPGWKGYQRFPDAMGYILTHWAWTWFDIRDAFIESGNRSSNDFCPVAPWWASNGMFNKWVNRSKYQDCSQTQSPSNKGWGPFLPCSVSQKFPETSLFFFYKLKFKFAGNSIWRPLPRNYKNDGMVPTPGGPTDPAETQSNNKKRPRHTDDIWSEDLDSDGILTDRALKRITRPDYFDLRRKMEDSPHSRRLKHLSHKLRHILEQRGLIKRLQLEITPPIPPPPWGGPPPQEVPPTTHPKKKKKKLHYVNF